MPQAAGPGSIALQRDLQSGLTQKQDFLLFFIAA
jgi:hypothetical protein